MANLQSSNLLDKHLKPIKSGEEDTSLELALSGHGAKVTGDLIVDGAIRASEFLTPTNSNIVFVDSLLFSSKLYMDTLNIFFFGSEQIVDGTTYYDWAVNCGGTAITGYHNTNANVGASLIINGGTQTAAASGITNGTAVHNRTFGVKSTLNLSSGSETQYLMKGDLTNTNIGGYTNIYLLHLTGAKTFWVHNNGNVALQAAAKLLFDGNGHTYITESADDILDIYVGNLNMMKFTESSTDKVEVLGSDLEIDATQKLYLDGGGDTYLHEVSADKLDVVVGGQTILEVSEGGGGASDSVAIQALNRFYFDGGGDTYIEEGSADVLGVTVGGDEMVRFRENGGSGNVVDFRTTSAGFTQNEPTYNASDTEVNFHTAGNKQFLTFGSGNITDLNLNFPDASCNCVLLVKQDGSGSRTITNYKTFDQAGGNESTVKFAGGSNPTLTTTANKLDIFSFYWDNDNHTAYGVVSQNF